MSACLRVILAWACRTLYDMCKALSHEIVICDTHLVEKAGGKSDFAARPH